MTEEAAPVRSKWTRRIVAALLSVLACLVLTELALHLFFAPDLAAVYRIHETWLYEYIPGAKKIETLRSEKADEYIPYEINADGFRGPPLRERGTSKRVMVYGDSFIASVGTVDADTFVARLGVELGAEVESINAGVVGYGPDQVLLRMESDLPKFKPDLVVVSVMPENDYGDLLRNRLFELGPSGDLRRCDTVIPQGMRDFFASAQSEFLLGKLWDRAVENSHRPNHGPGGTRPPDLTDMFLSASRGEFKTAVIDHSNDVMHAFFDHPDADVRLDPASQSAEYKRQLMARVLGAIADVAKRNSVPLVFVIVPAACDVCRGYDTNAADPVRFPAYRADNLTAPVERAVDSLGVPFVNLTEPFLSFDANDFYFHGGNGHWNAQGQAFGAKLVAKAIAKQNLLK